MHFVIEAIMMMVLNDPLCRVIMEVARQGLLPYGHVFGKVNPSIGSPVNAYLLQYALSILFILGPPPGAVYQFIVAFAAYPVYVSII
jgi:amino acid transporter